MSSKKVVVDTGVFADYIVETSPYRLEAIKILENYDVYVSTVTLAELLYVASRIYKAAGIQNPNQEALKYLEWIKIRTKIVEATVNIALRAGELKKKLRIALPDCFVLATAKSIGGTPIFRNIEKEMKPVYNELKKLGVVFLSEPVDSKHIT